MAILAPNRTNAAPSGHNSELNLRPRPLYVLHTKHSRSVAKKGRRRGAVVGSAEGQKRYVMVDAFHTFRHLFIWRRRRLHTTELESSGQWSQLRIRTMKRCRLHHRATWSRQFLGRLGPLHVNTGLGERHVPSSDASMDPPSPLFLSPLRRWNVEARAHEVAGCRKISVPTNRRSRWEGLPPRRDRWTRVGNKVTAASELREKS